MRYYASPLATMAEEDVKKDLEQPITKEAIKDSHDAQPTKNEKRPRKSSLKTSDEKHAKAQTPAQREAAKESQMHETFHDASNGPPRAGDNDAHLAKETGGPINNQTLNRSSTDLSGENDKSEMEKPMRKEDLFPGDNIIPDAAMVYDQKRTIRAPAEVIFPWLLQIGKNRGGWYLPQPAEKVLPLSWRPSRTIESKWQRLIPGERLPDYGLGNNDYLVVERVEEPHTIVFRSRRYGCDFTWALLLRELHDPEADSEEAATVVHLRFRGQIKAEGFRRRVVVKSGQVLEKLSTAPLLAGLAERCEQRGEIEKEKARASEKPSRRSWPGIRSSLPRRNAQQEEHEPRNSVS
ncbi:hypothetical protein CB0940_10180 [Cercospora beticola]|uniref:Uncharacterized protein n=2 Tax=Cercospora beticola TaxID=122368 RepID=A0A2G5HTF2_CERBT|nr:hypothetical protein CB0940_10180 [Cercospora beticola]PIA95809.1 hypothetical protein CB0940_10180 [Cercospora beticola]